MKFFVDTADTTEIADLAATGLLDGVTTNPSLIHKSGRKFLEVVAEICGIVDGPVSAGGGAAGIAHAGTLTGAEGVASAGDGSANAGTEAPDTASIVAMVNAAQPAPKNFISKQLR